MHRMLRLPTRRVFTLRDRNRLGVGEGVPAGGVPFSTSAAGTRLIEDADRWLDRRNVCSPCSIRYRVAAAIAYARAGHHDQARRRLDDAKRVAGMWHAAIWEACGVLRQSEGDTTRAAALYNEAADQFAELGRPLDRDRCRAEAQQATCAGKEVPSPQV